MLDLSVATLAYDDKVMNYNSYTQLIHLNEEIVIQTIFFPCLSYNG